MNREPSECRDLIELMEGTFDEVEQSICMDLRESNHEYIELQNETAALAEKYPVIVRHNDHDDDLALTAEEHLALKRYDYLTMIMGDIERLHIYVRGHKDSYAYLKMIGAV